MRQSNIIYLRPVWNKLTETKQNGAVYSYSYTVMNLVDTVTFKESSASTAVTLQEYAYNILANGNTTMTVTQYLDGENKATTTTTFDYAGRGIRVDQADGTNTTSTYNANGTLASNTDARGSTTYYAYDGLNGRFTSGRRPDRVLMPSHQKHTIKRAASQ